MGINNYYFNNIGSRLWDVDNYDFWLSSDNQGECLNYLTNPKDCCNGFHIITDGLVVWFDINNTGTTQNGDSIKSLVTWDDFKIEYGSGTTSTCGCYVAYPTNLTGITLCDIGLNGVDNGRYDKLSGITITLTNEDDKVILYPVTGYTINETLSSSTKGLYDYPISFLTGTTTNDGCYVGNTVCLNGGFYQGYFKLDLEKPNPLPFTSTTNSKCSTQIETNFSDVDPDALKYDLGPTNFECGNGNGGWSMETWVKWNNDSCSGLTGNTLNNNFNSNYGFFFYIGTRSENKFKNNFSGETGLYTCDGVIPLSPEEDTPRTTTDGRDWFSVSSFGRSGCCNPCENSDDEIEVTPSYCDELSENALGFRITEEGKIGYRKMTVSGYNYICGDVNSKFIITGTTMEESYSEDVVLTKDRWYHIVVTYTQNSVKNGLPAGTLRFWINGRVIYRVENFIGLKLRALNEYSSKQLGVPYNISWGGGSQGLLESQTFKGPDINDQGLDIATNFAGTFEGELSQLRFYDKPLNLMEIRNNFYLDTNRYCVKETYGGSQIVQPDYNLCGDACKKTNNIVFSDTLGLEMDLTVEFSPGSIVAKYMADIKKPLSKDITLKFKSVIDVISGDTITVHPEIFIPKDSTYGETTIIINDDYDRITDKHDVIDFEHITEEKIKIKINNKVIYKMPVKSSKSNDTPPTETNDDLIVYYGKLPNPVFDESFLGDLTSKVTESVINSYIGLEEGYGFGYILVPKEMEQPTLFRNSNEGCLGFTIPMIDVGEITLGEDNNGNSNNNNNGVNQSIYRIYRTYVSTYANVDIWLCD